MQSRWLRLQQLSLRGIHQHAGILLVDYVRGMDEDVSQSQCTAI